MPTIDLIQASLAGGEVSPSIYSRVDLDKYKSCLRTARNFITHPQGGISNRCGLEYISSAKYSASMCVTHEFIFNQEQAYTLEFGHQYIRFYTDGAQITQSGAAYEISTPYVVGDLNDLRLEASADVVWITHPSYQTRTLTRYGSANWVLDLYSPDDGPFMPDNTSESSSLTVSALSGTGVTLTLSASLVTDPTIVALLHFDGMNTSTTFSDDTGKIWTAFGNAQISTAQSVFGGASGLFDGTLDYISTPSSTDFNFSNGNFKVNFRARQAVSGSAQYFIHRKTDSVIGNDAFLFYIDASNKLNFTAQNTTTNLASYNTNAAVNIADGSWHDIEFGRIGTTFNIFLDGVSLALTASTAIASNTLYAADQPLYIAAQVGGGAAFNGYLDELVIYKGTAVHASNFTPATTPFSLTSAAGDFFFNSGHVGALFKLRHYIESQTVSVALASATTSSSIKCFPTWRLITHGTWAGKLRVEKSNDGGTTWTVLRSFSSSSDFNVDTSGTESIETNPIPFLVRLNMYAYTSGTCNADLTTDPFTQEGIVQATAYGSSTTLTVSVLQQVGATTATLDWAEGSWSTYRGFPTVARFYQDRLCFAATPSEPQTVWMTETSNYYSFIRHQTLLDIDGITVNLPSRQINQINGMIAFKQLLVFTSSAIWSIGPNTGAALTPTTVQQNIEEYSGAASLNPAVIGTEAIYTQTGNEIIRNIGFQLNNDGFTGSEANILAYHLFQGYSIVKIAYQKNPNSIVWCLRSDGVLLALTYNQEQNVVAWTHHDTNGTIESICCIPGDDSDELWVSVNRTNGRFIERMIGRKQFDLTGHVFVDSYSTQLNSTLVISGATHLRNQAVSVLADGLVLASQTVSASGTLTMSALYSTVYYGLQYLPDFEPLNIELPLKTGTLQGSKIKIGNVMLRLINSRGGWIGPNVNKLYEALTFDELNRAYSLQNNGSTLSLGSNFNVDIRVPLGGEYSNGGRFFLRQYDPLPISIGCIVPEIDPGGKSS